MLRLRHILRYCPFAGKVHYWVLLAKRIIRESILLTGKADQCEVLVVQIEKGGTRVAICEIQKLNTAEQSTDHNKYQQPTMGFCRSFTSSRLLNDSFAE
jgi:hypothetical protein